MSENSNQIVSYKDIAHDLLRDNPHLKLSKADGEHVIISTFGLITERVATGASVRVRGFGTFEAKMMKGRQVKSPLMKNGSIKFGDQLVLRFRQSQTAKKAINELAAKHKKAANKSARAAKSESNGGTKKTKPKKTGKKASKKAKAASAEA